ncbi:MAG: SEC-C metal-binding domain-containing protein [Betaproteobacteria bacterium]
MSAPGRNSPCPCGSGKRYKECHGAVAGQASPIAPVDDTTRRMLDEALAAQRAGRLADAVALYGAVIAIRPDTFDALHMLGVVHYQRGEFERAQKLLLSALDAMPSDAGARYNLQLIESVLERRMVERDICRDTLPRLAPRCVASSAQSDGRHWRNGALDVIVSTMEVPARWNDLERLVGWLDGRQTTVWLYPGMRRPAAATLACREIDAAAGSIPRLAQAIFVGAAQSPAQWYGCSAAIDVALYCCDDDDPCALLDRIPELAREGRTPVTLMFPSTMMVRRIGLPGIVVEGAVAIS